MAAMLHGRNNTILFLWDKMLILMQSIFIVLALQHDRHANPLDKKDVSLGVQTPGMFRLYWQVARLYGFNIIIIS